MEFVGDDEELCGRHGDAHACELVIGSMSRNTQKLNFLVMLCTVELEALGRAWERLVAGREIVDGENNRNLFCAIDKDGEDKTEHLHSEQPLRPVHTLPESLGFTRSRREFPEVSGNQREGVSDESLGVTEVAGTH